MGVRVPCPALGTWCSGNTGASKTSDVGPIPTVPVFKGGIIMTNLTLGTNSVSFYVPTTREEKLAFFEQDRVTSYIAPELNKHIFSVLPHGTDNSFFFGPDYTYGTDTIYEQEQVVIIEGGGCDCKLYWQDIILDGN